MSTSPAENSNYTRQPRVANAPHEFSPALSPSFTCYSDASCVPGERPTLLTVEHPEWYGWSLIIEAGTYIGYAAPLTLGSSSIESLEALLQRQQHSYGCLRVSPGEAKFSADISLSQLNRELAHRNTDVRRHRGFHNIVLPFQTEAYRKHHMPLPTYRQGLCDEPAR